MPLSPRENEMVALLAAGQTDAEVAAKLNLSLRTVTYTISGLMERYQVKNRFQLGLAIARESESDS